MILQALYDLAESEALMEDPDFEWKPIGYIIDLDEQGKLLGIRSTFYAPPSKGKRKPKPLAKKFKVPLQPDRSGTKAPAYFFVDNAKYVFGAPTQDKSFSEEEGEEKSGWFRNLVEECVRQTSDPGARAVLAFLCEVSKDRSLVPSLPQWAEWKSNDQFAFCVGPDIDRLVHMNDTLRDYWISLRHLDREKIDQRMMCLVTGRESCEIGNFPLLDKMPGKNTGSGVAFVSFNKKAFESYGLSRNQNAAISQDAAESCSRSLNRLLDVAYVNPHDPESSLPPRRYDLSADTTVLYWSPSKTGNEVCDRFPNLLDASPDSVPVVYHSIWRGIPPKLDDPSAFYALTLTGTQGRAIVRDWFESTVSDTLKNIARYFADIDIVRNTLPPQNGNLPPQIPLGQMLESLAVLGDREGIPAPLSTRFIRAALQGSQYPLSALQRAVERMRVEIGGDEWMDAVRQDARAAIIKAVLKRNLNMEVTRDMNPNNNEPGYVLGQLLAVFEKLQTLAMNKPNASVVDRYFSGASASPKSVFVRLYRNARHHVRKALDDKKTAGTAFLLDRIVDALTERLGISADSYDFKQKMLHPQQMSIPAFLPLDQQGQFMLGYHQMRKWIWMNKEERREWETQYPEAPRAFRWTKEKSEVESQIGTKVDL